MPCLPHLIAPLPAHPHWPSEASPWCPPLLPDTLPSLSTPGAPGFSPILLGRFLLLPIPVLILPRAQPSSSHSVCYPRVAPFPPGHLLPSLSFSGIELSPELGAAHPYTRAGEEGLGALVCPCHGGFLYHPPPTAQLLTPGVGGPSYRHLLDSSRPHPVPSRAVGSPPGHLRTLLCLSRPPSSYLDASPCLAPSRPHGEAAQATHPSLPSGHWLCSASTPPPSW